MKKIKTKVCTFFLVITSIILVAAPSVSAADLPYGMDYTGGEILGENGNVQVDPTLVEGLTRLIGKRSHAVFPESSDWLDGYVKAGATCWPTKYIRIWKDGLVNADSGYAYSVVGEKYTVDITFQNVAWVGAETTEDQPAVIVGVNTNGDIREGYWVYSDATCETKVENVRRNDNEKLYLEFKMKLHENGSSDVFTSDLLYFGMTDIDAAQSYKILNEADKLKPSNMFVLNAVDLQPEDSEARNMYVPSENYIYAQPGFNIVNNKNNVYVKISTASQVEGLDVVYGFRGNASSGINYYAKQYIVNYESDAYGAITGIETEDVLASHNPVGSSEEAAEHYVFSHWIADKDVELVSGEPIPAGNPIKTNEITKVIVNDDITFTAIHEKIQYKVIYDSDENGKITGIGDEEIDIQGSPSGSDSEPNEDYELIYWIADKDVTLEDGTVIPVGEPITPEQIKQVVVDGNITFTAIHEKKSIAVPDTGNYTGEVNGVAVIPVLITVLILGLVLAFSLRRLHKKNIEFIS